MAKKKHLVRPESRAAFLRLMEEHGTKRISWDAARSTGACQSGLERFQHRYFPGRRRLTLAELVPFVEYDTDYWRDVVCVVIWVLQDRGVLAFPYRLGMWLRPRKNLPECYVKNR